MFNFSKVVNGVEVYEVGIQQLRDMISCGGRLICDKYAQGRIEIGGYVVVTFGSYFGRFGSFVYIDCAYHGIAKAVNHANVISGIGFREALDAEVWHVVDDGNLWHEWDAMGECAARLGIEVHSLEDVWAHERKELMQKPVHVLRGFDRVAVWDKLPSVVYRVVAYLPDGESVYEDVITNDCDTWAEWLDVALNVNDNRLETVKESTLGAEEYLVCDESEEYDLDEDSVRLVTAYVRATA